MASRELKVNIVGDASSLERALGRANQQTSGFGKAIKQASYVAVGALAGIAVAAKIGFDELSQGQVVAAQTNAVLKSTGGIANVTAKEVEGLAQSQSRLTGIDDELIQAGENLLLTFKNVRNEVGKGSDVFDRATKAALDLSTAGFGSVESTSKMLGKALNDPVRGMTALSRAGVTFSQKQKDVIKRLVETGDVLGAQKVILKEVESQVGGSAKAWGQTLPGQLAKARNAFEEMAGNLTQALLPGLLAVAGAVSKVSGFFAEHQTLAKALVAAIAGLSVAILSVNVAMKAYAAGTAIWAAATKAGAAAQWLLNAALTANPIGLVVVALAALVGGLVLAYKHSETFRRIVDAAFKAVKVAAEAVLNFFRDNWKTIATLISGPFAPIVLLATDAFGIRSKLIAAAQAVLGFFRDNWKTIAVLISGPFAPLVALATDAFGIRSRLIAAFGAVLQGAREKFGALVEFMRGLPGRLVSALGDMSRILYNAGLSVLQGFWDGLRDKWNQITGWLSSLNPANYKGPKQRDLRMLYASGRWVMEGFQAGLEDGWRGVEGTLGSFNTRVPSLVGGGTGEITSWARSFKAFASSATQSLGTVGTAKDALSANYSEFTDSTEKMAAVTGDAWQKLTTIASTFGSVTQRVFPSLTKLLRDTSKTAASPMAEITAGLEKLAGGLNLVRAYLYGLRNAARDTLPEIWGLFKNHPVLPPSMFLGAAQTAPTFGPPVPAPLASMGGGPTIVLNFNGPAVGTGRDFEDTVRRALYDVSRRNPGALPGIA